MNSVFYINEFKDNEKNAVQAAVDACAKSGGGTLVGHGQSWWHWKLLQQAAAGELCCTQFHGIPVEERIFGTEDVLIENCTFETGIEIKGLPEHKLQNVAVAVP